MTEKKVKVEVTRVFREIQKATETVIINEGGARSTKSFSLCQHFIFDKLLVKHANPYKLLILRKVRHSLKLSTYKMFIEILKMYGIYDEKCHNKTDMTYRFPFGNYVQFGGMEDRQKIKSTGWSDIWLEEANEFEREDLTFLKTRLNEGEHARIYLSYNPEECWIQDLEGKPDHKFIFSNYKDNPFLGKHYIDILEGLKEEDDAYYKIYALGQRAKKGILIYNKYIMHDSFDGIEFEDTFYGLDFGYNNPCALLKLQSEKPDDMDIFLTELLYQTHLTTPELIELMKDLIPLKKTGDRDKPIYADSEDPNSIKQIQDAGFNVIPVEKGKGSVREGIIFSKRFKYHSIPLNVNLNKERSGYKWKKDKDGKILDEPVKFRDHLMNDKRYGTYMHKGIMVGNPTNIKDALADVDKGKDSEAAVSDAYLTEGNP